MKVSDMLPIPRDQRRARLQWRVGVRCVAFDRRGKGPLAGHRQQHR